MINLNVNESQIVILLNQPIRPDEPVQINIYQSNTYSKDLGWLHVDNQPRVR